ncbi:DUF4145 domain-containing protein [Brucella intermedia]|uniref:DUF4145 domain-containing protein n=1 Tax=Brucella intermedia TaxID=94625 RepID=UPI00158A1C6E|nr:DUF4145 domain-containing protein [Brucella intermedia]NYD84332.1 hypothetical protein [Brucella intermedia]
MAHIVVDCPHCGAQSLGMNVFGFRIPTETVVEQFKSGYFILVAADCGKCSNPITARIIPGGEKFHSWGGFKSRAEELLRDPLAAPERFGMKARIVYTPPTQINIPAHLPPSVEKSLKMAETNFRLADMEEASAAMYRRAIDLAVKAIDPTGKGDLINRINALSDKGILPGTMKDWAHQVRVIGNDGAHDIDGVTRNDLQAAQGFTDALLRYLFTLPREVEIRRASTEPGITSA